MIDPEGPRSLEPAFPFPLPLVRAVPCMTEAIRQRCPKVPQ